VAGGCRARAPLGWTPPLRAAKAEDAVTDQIHHAWLVMAALAAVVIATAAAVGALLARRLGRPLEQLAGTATRLGGGDFSVRAQRTGVTEIDAVAVALELTAERFERLVSRERAFSADASHQLRTPLAGLRLQLETAAERPLEDTAPVLQGALGQIDRLESTIDDLLALRRDSEAIGTPLRIGTVLDELERSWHGVLAARGRPLRVRVHEPLPPVAASEAAVRQVLEVLLANALEHGGGAVEVSARGTGGGVALEVTDDGPGIATDLQEAIFTRRAPGEDHGIGLALARSLAEAEGGRLLLRGPGPAPTFSLLLPPIP
jgi:signal transduction histidine kinase